MIIQRINCCLHGNKWLICSTLKTCGEKGENILLKHLKYNNDYKVKVAILSVLSYRIPLTPNYLKIKLDKKQCNKPGQIFTYYGNISPIINKENRIENECLEINSQDFLSSLQRMILLSCNHSNPEVYYNKKQNILDDLNIKQFKKLSFFNLNVKKKNDKYGENGVFILFFKKANNSRANSKINNQFT